MLFAERMQLFANQTIQHLYVTYMFVFYSYFPLQLLELPQFQDIIKIKTIGSTYMAASGLNPSRQVKVTNNYFHALSHPCEVKSKQDRQCTYGNLWRHS
jgi:hypothetical protein